MYKTQFLSALLVLMVVHACNTGSPVPLTKVDFNTSGELSIVNWQLIGPFQLAHAAATSEQLTGKFSNKTLLTTDNLVTFGRREATLQAQHIPDLILERDTGIFRTPFVFSRRIESPQGIIAFSDGTFNTNMPGNAYFACILHSTTEQDVVFLGQGDEPAQMYVNGTMYHFQADTGLHVTYSNSFFIHLNKGNNFILLKLANSANATGILDTEPWCFTHKICTPERYMNYYLALETNLLRNRVIQPNNPLVFSLQLPNTVTEATLDIFNEQGELVMQTRYKDTIHLDTLRKGMYKSVLHADQYSYSQNFYYGEIESDMERLFGETCRLAHNTYKDEHTLDYDTWVNWHTQQQKPGNNRIQLMSYRSVLDNTLQYYLVNKPLAQTSENTGLPLVVFLSHRSQSEFSSPLDVAISEALAVNAANTISGNDNYIGVFPLNITNGAEIENAALIPYIVHLMHHIQEQYKVDPRKISLFALNGSSRLALELAVKYPSMFSAIAIAEKPSFTDMYTDENMNDPRNYAENLYHIPTLLVNYTNPRYHRAGDFNLIAQTKGHSQVQSLETANLPFIAYPRLQIYSRALSFLLQHTTVNPAKVIFSTSSSEHGRAYWLSLHPITEGTKAAINATVKEHKIEVEVINAMQYSVDLKQMPINQNSDIELITNGNKLLLKPPYNAPVTISFTGKEEQNKLRKNQYTHGPILDVFKSGVIVVKGTQLKGLENTCNSWFNNFITKFEDNTGIKPVVKEDDKIIASDYYNNNLVVIGNQYTNSVFGRLYNELPIEVSDAYIKIDERMYKVNKLGYCVVYPNPLNPHKYLLLVGANNMDKVLPYSGFLPIDGETDFIVYTSDKNGQNIIEASDFNRFWRLK